jgi:carbonic anhydrase
MGFVDLHFALLSEEPNNLDAARVVSANEALKNLKAGNAGFAGGKSRHTHDTPDWRQSLEKGQHPFAVVLGCSDSRVPPELVFDRGSRICL